MTDGARGAGLEMGLVFGIVHEIQGGLLGGPLDDDAQGGLFPLPFEALVAGGSGQVLAPVLGHQSVGRFEVVRDPVFGSGGDGENGIVAHGWL